MPEKKGCKELGNEMDDAKYERRNAMNEMFDRANDLEHEADDIRDAHDLFPRESTMTSQEIVASQIGLIDMVEEEVSSQIQDVKEQMSGDSSDAGAGDSDLRERLDSLEKQLEDLNATEDRLGRALGQFWDAEDAYNMANADYQKKLDNWDQHCAPNPPDAGSGPP